MVETFLTCAAMYGGRTLEVPAWLSLRENQAWERETCEIREREREPSFYGSRWSLVVAEVWLHETWPPPLDLLRRWLNLLFILSPFVFDEHISLWFIDILLV